VSHRLSRLALIAIVAACMPLQVRAVELNPIPHSVYFNSQFYSTEDINYNACTGGAQGNGTLPSSVPAPYNAIFTAAASKHNMPPALLAAIFTEENGLDPKGGSWPNPNGPWPVSPAHAHGPFQFLVGTWDQYGEDGDGNGSKDIENLTDAAYGAANMLSANGGTNGAPEGPVGQPSISNAIWRYNPAQFYLDAVLGFYHTYLSGSTGGGASTAPPNSSASACGGGLGTSPEGFTFPQRTTKAQLAKQQPYHWDPNCIDPVAQMIPPPGGLVQRDDLCHHDYLAADIFNDTGVAVVAPRVGRVIRTNNKGTANGGADVGATASIWSDPSLTDSQGHKGDDNTYYLAHMMKPSEGGHLNVSVGDTIQPGDQVGVVGTNSDAEGTQHHTHIDISPSQSSFHRGFDGTGGPVLDPMPLLKAAYQQLPEN
jgi:Transglycosylase SLT domain